ncbi:MAG: nucleotide sugar dehydrogenase [Streptomycetaceae bacterium]|nr:MAG: nucleotide sugar dehydrogenase [Streptomycetaceae bacterium]
MSAQQPQILAIIGQGYVGLPLAMAAVDAGWSVIGVDNFEAKVAQINGGSSPVEDISDDQLQAAIAKGVYKATTDYSSVSEASVITICVPTPLDDKREPDLTLLRSAATGIAPYVSNETLVVSESTSYPGTLRDIIIPIINSLKPNNSSKIYFASAPERVNPGDPIWNQKNTPRLVGSIDHESQQRALAFYESVCDAAVSVSTPEVAEAAKLLENTFRLVNIALVNEFTQLCSASGINVHEVIDAASSKPYGFMPFRPGVGVGGHCIPVDPLYLTWWARQNGGKAAFVESADSINHAMPKYVADRALSMVDASIKRPKVLILGVAYKPGVGDVRETPVSELRDYLKSQGADVAWHDPLVPVWEGSIPVDLDWDCDVAILATKQPGMDLEQLINKGIKILDCTNSITGQAGASSL